MPTKTYNIQIVWNDVGGMLAHVNGEIEWDQQDARSIPRLLCEDGTKVEIDKNRLKGADEDGLDFIYESPGFTPPT